MAELKAKIGLETNAFETGLARLQGKATTFAKGLGAAFVGAFAFERLISGFSAAIEKGDQLQDIAEKFGLSASKLQMLGNAASVYGSSLENVSMGLNKLSLAQQRAVSGDETLQKTFREVGISMDKLKTMGPEDVFLAIADSFASGANDGRQFLIVNELLGKAQTDLIKVMNQGSAAIIEQGTSIGVWGDETIARLSAASDAIKTLQNLWTVAFGAIAASIIKAAAALSSFLGLTSISQILTPSPIAKIEDGKPGGKTEAQSKNEDKISENLRKQLDLENKIAEKEMTQEQVAQRLLATYSALASQKKLVESFKTEEGDIQASAIGVEMAQIKDRLSGMSGASGSMQVLADSLQQVGGGSRFAQVGGNETKDYLRAIKDSSAITAKALTEIKGVNRGDVTPVGAQ
ncbi:hypothetical protein EBZ39_04245 [bacterium]|nr:hypothetical protein [bacterium]